MRLDLDYASPTTQFSFDLNKNTSFKKDNNNYINSLSIHQLNTLDQLSLLDIYLSTNNVVEPHYHQNSSELVYCISGSAVVSIFNPYTRQLHHYPITPGQVANVPQGWWHYEIATTDQTHLLAIFNAPTPDVILFSDLLKFTPSNLVAHTYCLDENKWNETLSPLQPSTFIGPPINCHQNNGSQVSPAQNYQTYSQAAYQPYYQQPRYW